MAMTDRAHLRPQGPTTRAASSFQRVECPLCRARLWDAPAGTVVRVRRLTPTEKPSGAGDVVKCRRCTVLLEVERTFDRAA